MHRHFDEQILEVRRRLVRMGNTAVSMLSSALRLLMERDGRHREAVDRQEEEGNGLQLEIDDRVLKLTALQQPVGSDVRFLFVASKIASELERIGDQVVNVCRSAEGVIQAPPLKPLVDLPAMAALAQKMVRDGLESLVRKDEELSRRVLRDEEGVDAFRDQIFRELLTYMMADPATIPRALALLLISRSLERVGDHATNIAEEVIFWIRGTDIRHHRRAEVRSPGETGDA